MRRVQLCARGFFCRRYGKKGSATGGFTGEGRRDEHGRESLRVPKLGWIMAQCSGIAAHGDDGGVEGCGIQNLCCACSVIGFPVLPGRRETGFGAPGPVMWRLKDAQMLR